MDGIEIALRREDNRICVQCTPAEEAMVMTAWMEVASRMNDLAREIAKPIRKEDMGKMLESMNAAEKGHEGVRGYLRRFVMIPDFSASTKEEAIGKLVAEIAHACPEQVPDAAAAVKAVLRREASMPTGLDHGIAVPHGRDPSVKGIVGAVAIVSPNASIADYETIDNSAVRILVLTLANDGGQTPYLKLMSYISRALRANGGVERLAACRTVDEMRRFFKHTK